MIGELSLILLAGLLGSSHCIGMCGGFAMIVGLSTPTRQRVLLRQLVYSAGRIFTYAFLGGIAGFAGHRIVGRTESWGAINVAAVFSVLCGLFLIVQGLAAAGLRLRRRHGHTETSGPCLSGMLLGSFLRGSSLHRSFVGGVLTGLLPCGLVYGFLALAAAKADPFRGMAVMSAFGLGTVPLMVLAGLGTKLLGLVARQRLLRVAAGCVVLTGVLTVIRGAGYLRQNADEPVTCPFCSSKD